MGNMGYHGPGLWVRIQHRFRTRMTEWMLAIVTGLWGAVLLLPGDAFDQPAFSGFKQVFGDETTLGLGMVTLGALRVIGLFINGARQNVTPHIRMFSAGCGFMIFMGISYCYMLSDVVSTWIAIYPPFVIVELVNAYRAAHAVGEAHGQRTS